MDTGDTRRYPLAEALEAEGLTQKATDIDGINIALLDAKEQIRVLGHLGDKARSLSFSRIMRTAQGLPHDWFSDANRERNKVIKALGDIPFPIIEKPSLFVRDSYHDIFTELTSRNPKDPLCVLTGTPGIGKSSFLIYFTFRLLFESTDDNPCIIIFHPAVSEEGSPELFAFAGKSVICQ